jgi:hypothetical protein
MAAFRIQFPDQFFFYSRCNFLLGPPFLIQRFFFKSRFAFIFAFEAISQRFLNKTCILQSCMHIQRQTREKKSFQQQPAFA